MIFKSEAFASLIVFASFPAQADFYVMQQENRRGVQGGAYPMVATSAEEARSLGTAIYRYSSNAWDTSHIAHHCEAGGWWALISFNYEEKLNAFGGGCNHISRTEAKKAALSSCRKKPSCNQYIGHSHVVMSSGFDDPKFNVRTNYDHVMTYVRENRGVIFILPPRISSRQEGCTSENLKNDNMLKCYSHGAGSGPISDSDESYMFRLDGPVTNAPWDK